MATSDTTQRDWKEYVKDCRMITRRSRVCEVCGERPAVLIDRQILHVCRQCAVAESEGA